MLWTPLKQNSPEAQARVISTAVVLHNICVTAQQEWAKKDAAAARSYEAALDGWYRRKHQRTGTAGGRGGGTHVDRAASDMLRGVPVSAATAGRARVEGCPGNLGRSTDAWKTMAVRRDEMKDALAEAGKQRPARRVL